MSKKPVSAMCESTGMKAKKGVCPAHGGDACLFNPVKVNQLYDQLLADVPNLIEQGCAVQRKRILMMFRAILDTAEIEEWKAYTGDLVYDRTSPTISIIIKQMKDFLEKP